MDYKLLLSRLLKFSDPVAVRRRDVFFCVMFIPLYTKIPLSCCYSRRISAFPAMKMDKMKIFVAKKTRTPWGGVRVFVFLYIRAVIAAVRPKMMPGAFATTIGHSGFLRKSP